MKTLITAALPYANGSIHFGHLAGAYLPADCYARFSRLKGDEVLFICGSDEYGVAITLSAELAGRTCKEHVDIFHEVNKSLFQRLNISFDHYSRTTNPFHAEFCQKFFLELLKNGYIETMESDQLYCKEDNRFYADRYVVGTCPKCGYEAARGDECTKCGASFEAQDLKNPKAKQSGKPLTLKKTKHWFLRLDLFKDKLQKWISEKNWKPNVVNFIKSYIDDLRPRAITRDMSWGIPVPLEGAEGKVLYVWFDAPLGYISASQEWAHLQKNPDLWKDYWLDPETQLTQFIGKDNIPFHAVVFPSMIMGQDLPLKLVDNLPANEFYNLEGRQFSKSEGWYIDLASFIDLFDPEVLRYTIASNAPETQDADFTWKDFQLKCNSELVGKFGNFIHRTLSFIQQQCQGLIPEPSVFEECDRQFLDDLKALLKESFVAYNGYKLRRASQLVMEIAQRANVYFDMKKPWKDAKDELLLSRMRTTLFCCLEAIKYLSLASSPILPTASLKAFEMSTGTLPPRSWDEWALHKVVPCVQLPVPSPLFKKLEDIEIDSARKTLMTSTEIKNESKIVGTQVPESKDGIDQVTIQDFGKVDLRVVTIVRADLVPKSKKLLRLDVDTGSGIRQIVSGIAQHFAPEDLVGRSVIAVLNLPPAKLMGIESHGMILTAEQIIDGVQTLQLLSAQDMPAGSKIR